MVATNSVTQASVTPDSHNYLMDLQAITAILLLTYSKQLIALNNVGIDMSSSMKAAGNLAAEAGEKYAALQSQIDAITRDSQIVGSVLMALAPITMTLGGAASGLGVREALLTTVNNVAKILTGLATIAKGGLDIAVGVFKSESTQQSAKAALLTANQDNTSRAVSWTNSEMKSSIERLRDLNKSFTEAVYDVQNGLSDALQLRA